MRIAIFTDMYRPILGGITESVVSTVDILRANGIKTFLFTPWTKGTKDEKDTIFFPTFPVKFGGTIIRTAFPYSSRVTEQFSSLKVDLIHCFSSLFVGHFAKSLAHRYHLPTVFTYQSRHSEYLHFLPFGKQLSRLRPIKNLVSTSLPSITKTVCNGFDCVIAPTPSAEHFLKDIGVTSRIEIIPVGFDVSSLQQKTIDIKNDLHIPKETILFLYLGRLSSEKNLPFLLRAFAKALHASSKKLHLLLVGDGPQKAFLIKMTHTLGITKYITFTGAIPHTNIGAYFQAADSFVFSSLSDVQAFVVCESLIAGIPVIAVNAPGPADFITDGTDGILTPCDENLFARAIISLAKNESLRKKLARNALQKGIKLFPIEKYGKSLITLYHSLIKNNS